MQNKLISFVFFPILGLSFASCSQSPQVVPHDHVKKSNTFESEKDHSLKSDEKKDINNETADKDFQGHENTDPKLEQHEDGLNDPLKGTSSSSPTRNLKKNSNLLEEKYCTEDADLRSLHEKAPGQVSFDYLAENSLKGNLNFKNSMIAGLSGLFYDESSHDLYVLSDDYGDPSRYDYYVFAGQNVSRYYTFNLSIEENQKTHDVNFNLSPKDVFFFQDKKGYHYKNGSIDPEAIALLPNKNILIASEQDPFYYISYYIFGMNLGTLTPKILEFTPNGQLVSDFTLPSRYIPKDWETTGITPNKGFEGLTVVNPDDDRYFAVMTEVPLQQDTKNGADYNRFALYKRENGDIVLQDEYSYKMSELPKDITEGASKVSTGISEILSIGDNNYLALERSYVRYKKELNKAPQSVNRVYQFYVDPKSTTNTCRLETLPKDLTPLKKRLVLDLNKVPYKGKVLDFQYNFEGMTVGPKVDGHKTLLIVSDNNFEKETPSQFLLFKMNQEDQN